MEILRPSTLWVIDYQYDGRPRRWLQVLDAGRDAHRFADEALRERHEPGRARLVGVRLATPQEELDYVHGDEPRNVYCPTGRPRHDRDALEPPADDGPLSAG